MNNGSEKIAFKLSMPKGDPSESSSLNSVKTQKRQIIFQ